MELRAFGCFVLAYFSVYALFWLFDNHERLIGRSATGTFNSLLREVGQDIADYVLGFFWFGASSFGVQIKEGAKYPPPVQIWGAVAVLFLIGFFFSDILCGEALALVVWEQVGLLALMIFLPSFKLARQRFAKR